MDRIGNMTFKSGHEIGLWNANEELKHIKKAVSRRLNIGCEWLNEIALEDIEIKRSSQEQICRTLYDLTVVVEIGDYDKFFGYKNPCVPCAGFWIEGSRELILYAWNDYQDKTVTIPYTEWFMREDITVH